MAAHPELIESKDGILVAVHVQPGAGSTELVGRHGAALKVRVAAPPSDGRANEAVAQLLAKAFGLAPGDVELTSGQTSRQKRFRLGDLDRVAAEKLVEQALERSARRA
jgi:uncharacterized protein (TIGR00251 family)